jgi:hypothetical protein
MHVFDWRLFYIVVVTCIRTDQGGQSRTDKHVYLVCRGVRIVTTGRSLVTAASASYPLCNTLPLEHVIASHHCLNSRLFLRLRGALDVPDF